MAIHDQIEELARKHGATSYRNRADTQNPAYGFTPAGLLNLIAELTGEVRKQDEALIRQVLEALEVTASDVCQVAHHKKRDQHGNGDVCPVQARHDEAIAAGRARLEGDHFAGAGNMVQIAVETDEVLVAIKRPDGYEDVHPELVAADALPSTPFEYRVAWPLELEP